MHTAGTTPQLRGSLKRANSELTQMGKAMRTCVVCGVSIEGRQWSALTCSARCKQRGRMRRKYLRKNPQFGADRACVVCGISFPWRHPNAITCSKVCAREKDKRRCAVSRAEKWKSDPEYRARCIAKSRKYTNRKAAYDRKYYFEKSEHKKETSRQYYLKNFEVIRRRSLERAKKDRAILRVVRQLGLVF
jgi:predicted nucleic acid-binding Zn ribbon protein